MLEGIVSSIIASAIIGAMVWFYKRFCSNKCPEIPAELQSYRPFLFLKKIKILANLKARHQVKVYNRLRQSTVFFAQQFSKAFPGCREICEIDDPKEAINRLNVLLEKPLSGTNGRFTVTPIWWFRGQHNMHIDAYQKRGGPFSENGKFLLNDIYDYQIKKLIAVSHPSYFRKFVYVEIVGMEPSGVGEPCIAAQVERKGYAHEECGEYGTFRKRYVTREEYDDGAIILNGKPFDISKKVKLRVRSLTPYNFLIAPHASPINNKAADAVIENFLTGILKNETSIPDLIKLIFQLPKNEMDI